MYKGLEQKDGVGLAIIACFFSAVAFVVWTSYFPENALTALIAVLVLVAAEMFIFSYFKEEKVNGISG